MLGEKLAGALVAMHNLVESAAAILHKFRFVALDVTVFCLDADEEHCLGSVAPAVVTAGAAGALDEGVHVCAHDGDEYAPYEQGWSDADTTRAVGALLEGVHVYGAEVGVLIEVALQVHLGVHAEVALQSEGAVVGVLADGADVGIHADGAEVGVLADVTLHADVGVLAEVSLRC